MERIERVVRTAWRRLLFGRFATHAARAAVVLSALLLVAILAARAFSISKIPLRELAYGLAPVAMLYGAIAAFVTRPTRLGAAAELDRRCGLGERVSSALLVGAPREAIQAAVVADAEARIDRIDVRRAIPIGIPRDVPRAAGVLVAAALVATFLPELGLLRESKGAQDDPKKASEEKRAREDAKKIEQVKKRIEESAKGKDMPVVAAAVQEMEDLAKRLKVEPSTKKQELAKLSALEEKLKEKMRTLPQLDKLGQQMRDMPQTERTRDLQGAMAQQQLDKAKMEAQKLVEQAAEAMKKGDTKKLDDMAKELEKLAKAAEGSPELQQALDKLAKAMSQQAKAQAENPEAPLDPDMAKGLESAAKDLQQALDDAKQAEEEAELLAKAAEGIGKAKEGLQSLGDEPQDCPDCESVCPNCKAASCAACGTPECIFAGVDPKEEAGDFDCQCPGGT